MVGQVSAAGSGDPVRSVLAKLRFFSEGLGTSFGIKCPPLPELASMASVKEFCSGLLENPTEHPWGEWAGTLRKGTRMSIAHSLFLFRKSVPAEGDPRSLSASYVKKMCRSGDPADRGFLEFITKEIPRLFPRGWDRGYRGRAGRLLLPVKACVEAGRRLGGGRTQNKRLPFLRRVALGYERIDQPNLGSRVTTVVDGCKLRVVSVSSVEQAALSPLHDTLYDHLSKQSWLLRGDATPRALSHFTHKRGEVFVSGDYVSATDNLKMDVYHHLLDCLQKTSSVASGVWDLARQRSRLLLYAPGTGISGWQARGQLMGTFLSFPLLCLVNYLTFKYLVRRDVPVLINGDDILFRATMEEFTRWKEGVGKCGLELSPGKTMVDEDYATINSTLFRCGRVVHIQPFVRARALFSKPESPQAVAGQFASLAPGLNGKRLHPWQRYFLSSTARSQINLSQRSVRRGLGMRVSDQVLRQVGLYRRERFYSNLSKEEPLPASLPPGEFNSPFPQGFRSFERRCLTRQEWRRGRDMQATFHLALRLHAQSSLVEARTRDSYIESLHRGTERLWFPRKPVVRYFTYKWQRLCRPYPALVQVGRQEERLMLPFDGEEGQRKGVGWHLRPSLTDWAE